MKEKNGQKLQKPQCSCQQTTGVGGQEPWGPVLYWYIVLRIHLSLIILFPHPQCTLSQCVVVHCASFPILVMIFRGLWMLIA